DSVSPAFAKPPLRWRNIIPFSALSHTAISAQSLCDSILATLNISGFLLRYMSTAAKIGLIEPTFSIFAI
ncbi:MAG: hypothetical protein FWG22_04370, partial [Prolixibacteraceae bacterium]|nr:hypothetical protein [Prolixibacteraceae bacterium]